MNNEVITIMADQVPFWGNATWFWTVSAVGIFVALLILSIVGGSAELAGAGVAIGVLLFAVGILSSVYGVSAETNRSLEAQLRETVGIENLSYSRGDFTGSLEGRYVRGTLVHLEGERYQVVELDTSGKGD